MYNKELYKEILDYFSGELDLVNCEIKSLLVQDKTAPAEGCGISFDCDGRVQGMPAGGYSACPGDGAPLDKTQTAGAGAGAGIFAGCSDAHSGGGAPAELYNDISAFLFAKSKRLRPVFLFLINESLDRRTCGKINESDITSPDNTIDTRNVTAGSTGKNVRTSADLQCDTGEGQCLRGFTKDGGKNGSKNGAEVKKKIIKLAAALELLHGATLIHDDIVDDAPLRRNLQTFNDKYGSKLAVLAGDYLLSLSLRLIYDIGEIDIFKIFFENTLNICKGEIDQFLKRGKAVSLEDYIEKSKNKTGSLFMAGVKSLLILKEKEAKEDKRGSALDEHTKQAYLDFSENFSLGFQIYDDIENFVNERNISQNAADKASSDIENGIFTLPYLYLSQQNLSCDIINLIGKDYDDAIKFSKNYLNKVLDNAITALSRPDSSYKTEYLIKLVQVFKS